MVTYHLGQFDSSKKIKIATGLNRKVTGLTDVTLDIYDPNENKIVSNADMTELNSEGIYIYDYTMPTKPLGTYTFIISCPSQRNYLEIQTATSVQPSGGGWGITGDIIQDLKIIKDNFIGKKEIKELLEKINEKVDKALEDGSVIETVAEQQTSKFNQRYDQISKELESMHKKINGDLNKVKESLANEIGKGNTNIESLREGIKGNESNILKDKKEYNNLINQLDQKIDNYDKSMNEGILNIKKRYDELLNQNNKLRNDFDKGLVLVKDSNDKKFMEMEFKFNENVKPLFSKIDNLKQAQINQSSKVDSVFSKFDQKYNQITDKTSKFIEDNKKEILSMISDEISKTNQKIKSMDSMPEFIYNKIKSEIELNNKSNEKKIQTLYNRLERMYEETSNILKELEGLKKSEDSISKTVSKIKELDNLVKFQESMLKSLEDYNDKMSSNIKYLDQKAEKNNRIIESNKKLIRHLLLNTKNKIKKMSIDREVQDQMSMIS